MLFVLTLRAFLAISVTHNTGVCCVGESWSSFISFDYVLLLALDGSGTISCALVGFFFSCDE